jgi:hypothetical protein
MSGQSGQSGRRTDAPVSDTPRMETRTFQDDQGRQWAGSVISGRFSGGEDRAEVIFVCEDQPGEARRFARLDAAPAEAADRWREMEEGQVRGLFLDSEPV